MVFCSGREFEIEKICFCSAFARQNIYNGGVKSYKSLKISLGFVKLGRFVRFLAKRLFI